MVYLGATKLARNFGHERKWSYRILSEIEKSPEAKKRYRGRRMTLDGPGGILINAEIVEDYLANRADLQNRNLARRLAPYGGKG